MTRWIKDRSMTFAIERTIGFCLELNLTVRADGGKGGELSSFADHKEPEATVGIVNAVLQIVAGRPGVDHLFRAFLRSQERTAYSGAKRCCSCQSYKFSTVHHRIGWECMLLELKSIFKHQARINSPALVLPCAVIDREDKDDAKAGVKGADGGLGRAKTNVFLKGIAA